MKYNIKYNNEALRKNISLLTLSVLTAVAYVLISASVVSAAPPDATNRMPNNPSGGNEPWLVLTTPGSNGMDAPAATVSIYSTVSAAPVYIENACDTSAQDGSGANNTTNFSIPKARVSSVTNVVGAYDLTNDLQNLIRVLNNDPTYIIDSWFFRCNGTAGNDMSMTLNFSPSAISQIGDTDYYSTAFTGVLSDQYATSYYANRFKLRSSNSGVNFSYAATTSPTGPGTKNALYTGIAFSDASSGWGWSTQLAFAEPCRTGTSGVSRNVWFYDSDYTSGTASSPYWQDSANPISYSIQRYNRNTGAAIGSPITGNLTGGQNTADKTKAFNTYPNEKYVITISGINYVNSIQIALPLEQINANEPCPVSLPECAISNIVTFNGNKSTILPGERIKFTTTVAGASGYRVGVNGSGYGNEYGGTDIKNYLVSGKAYARGPTFSSDASTSVTVSALGYSDSASVSQAFSAPTTAGSYDFSWGLVKPGTGWKPVTCSGTLTVSDKPVIPVPKICTSYPPNTLNFKTIQKVYLPRPPVGSNAGHDTSPWTYSSAGGASSPSSSLKSISNTVTNTKQTRVYKRTVTYTRKITYTQVYRNPSSPARTNISKIVDQYGETLDIPSIGTDGSGNYIHLDYLKHFNNYPYDEHTPRITYSVGYERRQRIGTITQTDSSTTSYTQTRTRANKNAKWTLYNPPNINNIPVPGPSFSSPAAEVGSASTINNDNQSYTGRRDGSNPVLWSALAPVFAAPKMPPCFPRHYDATPGISGPTLTRGTAFNREDPDSATVTFTIPATLSFKNGGNLRTATTVTGLDYTVNWYAQGYSNPGLNGTYSGKVNIANTSFTNNTPGSSGTLTQKTQSFTIPNDLEAGDRVCFTVTVPQAIGRVKVGGERWLPGNTPKTTGIMCTQTVVDEPYTRFYGADISAGGGFNTNAGLGTCSNVNPEAKAFGPMRSGIFAGSGAQLAVFAINEIQGIQPLSRSDRTPTELAFANTTPNINTRLFGGGFGSKLCAHDYFGDVPEDAPWVVANVDLGSLEANDTDRYYRQGDISLTGLLPDGKRAVIYVDGNVTIQSPVGGKVGFATSTYEWGSIDQVPSLYIIASGNINVNNDVTRLDGSFISQGGVIKSCTVDGDDPTTSELTEQCRTQLVVNGAFIADTVRLLRTFGSLRDGVELEDPSSTSAAETFMFNPTQWMTSGGGLPSNSKMQIDSYTSLPPSL